MKEKYRDLEEAKCKIAKLMFKQKRDTILITEEREKGILNRLEIRRVLKNENKR